MNKQIDSNNDDAWYNKAVALDYLQKFDAALESYDRSIDINPDNAVAWHGKALVLERLGNNERAQICFNKARQFGIKTSIYSPIMGLSRNSNMPLLVWKY